MFYRGTAASCRNCAIAMGTTDFRGVRYERCPQCASVWIQLAALRALWVAMEPERPLHFADRPPDGRDRLCPDCNRSMAPAFLPHRVPVEWCDAHGVWLDPEELGVTLAAAYLDEERWWRELGGVVRSFT
jgi:Zn-finger nucleic acid-binding protein